MNATPPTLNETLAALGYTTRPAGNGWSLGSKAIIAADRSVVFTGDSVEVWAWLNETAQIKDVA